MYFDAAATTLQKPASVRRAVMEAMETMSSPGRGGYPSARRAEQLLLTCRTELAEFFGVSDPQRVVFTSNATHGLNIAIHSLVRDGANVVISGYEHNAVTRCLQPHRNLHLRVVDGPLFHREAMVEGFRKAVTEDTDCVICTHVSNVFGFVLPVEEIAAICRKKGVPLIVDASQSAGILPVQPEKWGAAFTAMPGHKGLYGPQGTGVLLCGSDRAEPLLRGGTGSSSRDQEMPDFLPDRLEAGTHNVHGAAGLLAGLRFVRRIGIDRICAHGIALKEQLLEGLEKDVRFVTLGVHDPRRQIGVLSFCPKQVDPETMAERLAARGAALRGGLHCAPLAHETAGTEAAGTLRFSVSAFNTGAETERLLRMLREEAGRA